MVNEEVVSGAEFYRRLYRSNLPWSVEWLHAGAANKVFTVETLLSRAGLTVNRLCELGCGTGAVLRRCRELGIGSEWFGVDYSGDCIAHLAAEQPEIHTVVGDASSGCPFQGTHFEVLLLTHVAEHLEDPAALLKSLRQWSYGHLLIEVPLENLPLLRLKCKLFGRNNAAGHVQFFDAESFRNLLLRAGFEIVGEYRYAPVLPRSVYRRMLALNRIGYAGYVTKLLSGHLLPRLLGSFWTNWYYAHHAILCKPICKPD